MVTITEKAYAKINLFLDISGIRQNGYHNIISLMQTVGLCDEITVTYEPSSSKNITVTCSDSLVPIGRDNLVFRAAELIPIDGSIHIHIEKNIPMSAGLAGGSSDAAATLVALNKLCDKPMSKDELKSIGLRLGADVPFCIEGGAAIAEGVGEVLTPVYSMPYFPMVIAKKGEGMSTPDAYKALDIKYDMFKNYEPKTAILKSLLFKENDPDKYSKNIFNIFEETVSLCRPEVNEIKKIMTESGASGAMMSGSGTSVFGIFKNEALAYTAFERLVSCGAEAHICYPK